MAAGNGRTALASPAGLMKHCPADSPCASRRAVLGGLLGAVLRLRLRPVWGVTSARLLRNPFLPGFLPDATQGVRANEETEDDYSDVPKRVEGLLQSLSMVVALGILPPAVVAPNVAHELQNLLELWATPA